MKPRIGILATLKEEDKLLPYENYYKVSKIYVEKIKEAGGIPFGILDTNHLDFYDGFLLTGGNKVTEDHYKVIQYAIKNKKPLYGICAGMQAMLLYEALSEKVEKEDFTGADLQDKYKELRSEGTLFFDKVEGHGGYFVDHPEDCTVEKMEEARHEIKIEKDSILYQLYQTEKKDLLCLHHYGFFQTGKMFHATAWKDEVVEAIELKDKSFFIIGTQFHPEFDLDDPMIPALIEKSAKKNIAK